MVTKIKEKIGPALFKSLRIQILMIVSGFVAIISVALILYVTNQFEELTELEILHEGLLLSDTLEAGIGGLSDAFDASLLQGYIDRLISIREKNDVEINIILQGEDHAAIVASNVPDNLEDASEDEYALMLSTLETGKPHIFVERSDEELDPDDDPETFEDPEHPDYYFQPGTRELSIMTPLIIEGKVLGGINIKLSLSFLDDKLALIHQNIRMVLGAALLCLGVGIVLFMNFRLFNPLWNFAESMYLFGIGRLEHNLSGVTRADEIGVLTREFNNMVTRLKNAEVLKEEVERAKVQKERKKLEDQLRQAQKMEAIGTLAGGIAHDFNNILSPIIGYTEMSTEYLPKESRSREFMDQVLKAAFRAKDLVQQILAFSRQDEQERTPIQVAPIVKEVLKLLRASLPTTIDIQQDIKDKTGSILADPTQIHQVIMNLCTNAYHAMGEESGTLGLSLSEEYIASGGLIENLNLAPGTYVKLMIRDTGHGMSKALVDRIFEPYFTTKKEGEGTGLGLSMVHGIIKTLEGHISVYSEPDQGTTFKIYIPVIEQEAFDKGSETVGPVVGGTERILIVDDEEQIAAMLKDMLTGFGYQVTAVNSSLYALEIFQMAPDKYDLVITDMTMPHLTGARLAQKLIKINPEIKIILCSGYSNTINEKKAESIGIKAYVMKPVIKNTMAKTIRRVLDQ